LRARTRRAGRAWGARRVGRQVAALPPLRVHAEVLWGRCLGAWLL